MAVNPQFVYTNPVAAQQAVQMFQLQQAAEDAMRRNAQENIRTFGQQNIARENAAQQRAYTQAQLAQRDRELAQQQAQFTKTDERLNRQLDVSKTLTESDIAASKEDEIFQALQNAVISDDPPTDLEFVARTEGLKPHRKQILEDLRQKKINHLNRNADIAENKARAWQIKLDALKPEDVVQRKALEAQFEKSKDRNYLEFDPTSNTFRSLLRRPRTDAILGPELPTGSGVTPIEDILSRVPTQSVGPTPGLPGGFPGSTGWLDVYRSIAPEFLGGRPSVPVVPTQPAPTAPVNPVQAPAFDWESAVRSYLPQYPR